MMRRRLQGIFVLGGLALVITGFNNSSSLVVVGFGMMVLAVLGLLFSRNGS